MRHFYRTASDALLLQGYIIAPSTVAIMMSVTYAALARRLGRRGWVLPETDEGKLFVLDVETPNGFIY